MVQQPSADEIQAAAFEAWIEGKLNKEFTAKQQDRGIGDAEIKRVLRSNGTLIGRYRDHDQPRYGFWHPENEIFVAWQPKEEDYVSELKSCFSTSNEEYMREREEFVPLRGFEERYDS